jgi:hypothetical protein
LGNGLSARIAAYLTRLPNLGEGQGRDDVAYRFAAFLTRDLGLAEEIALGWLERWDSGNTPPKGRDVLAGIMANARRYGRRAYGCGLGASPARRPGRGRRGHTYSTISCSLEIS